MASSSKRRTIIFALAVVAALFVIAAQSGLLILLGNTFSIEGDVISITGVSGVQREAMVQLKSGTVVRAAVPAACVVFPGQVAKLPFTGPLIGSGPAFWVWESREKQ